jgi:hypothetical protein
MVWVKEMDLGLALGDGEMGDEAWVLLESLILRVRDGFEHSIQVFSWL